MKLNNDFIELDENSPHPGPPHVVFVEGEKVRLRGVLFEIRKITKKDIVLRPTRPIKKVK